MKKILAFLASLLMTTVVFGQSDRYIPGNTVVGNANSFPAAPGAVSANQGGILDNIFYQTLLGNGCTFTAGHDDGPCWQLTINTCTITARCQGLLPPSLKSVINTGLVWTMSDAGVNFNGLKFDASGMTTGCLPVTLGTFTAQVTSSTQFNVTVVGSGVLNPGDVVVGTGFPAGSTISYTPGSGVGLTGTYNSTGLTTGSSETITTVGCYAMEWLGNGSVPFTDYVQASPFENFVMIGPASTSSVVDAIYIGAPTGSTAATGQTFRNFKISGFHDDLYLGSFAYINQFYAGDIEGAWRCGINAAGTNTAGENASFFGGQVSANNTTSKGASSGNSVAICMRSGNQTQEIFSFGQSLDYNDKIFSIYNGGWLNIIGGHQEDSHYANSFGDVTFTTGFSSGVRVIGGTVTPTEASANSRTSIYTATGANANVKVSALFAAYNNSAVLVTASGGPKVSIDGIAYQSSISATAFAEMGLATNQFQNPGFETSSSSFLPWSATGSTWTIDTATPRTGSNDAKIVQTAGNAALTQTIPVTQNKTLVLSAYYNLSAYTSGQAYLRVAFFDQGASFAGTIATTVLTIPPGQFFSGTLHVGDAVTCNGCTAFTISSLGTGGGGTGTYNISTSQTVTTQTAMSSSHNLSDTHGTAVVATTTGYAGQQYSLLVPPGALTAVVYCMYGLAFIGTNQIDDCEVTQF